MLCLNEKSADYMGQGVTEKVLACLTFILGDDVSIEKR